MDPFCYLCFVSVILSYLFIAAFWSPPGKRLTSLLSCVMLSCVLSLSHVCPGSGMVLWCIDS